MSEPIFFAEGDWVQSKLNSEVFGIVVGDADFGRFVNVQLAGSLEIKPFHAVTLEAMDGEPDDDDFADNVVHVDFTKPHPVRATTKTEGNA